VATAQSYKKCVITVLSNRADIEGLGHIASPLLANCEFAATPKFFLAAVDENVWAPRVMIVREADTIIGIVYAKERIFAGLPTGIIFADSTLNSMVVAEPLHRETMLRNCLQTLVDNPRVRALRLLLPQSRSEHSALRGISSKIAISKISVKHHSLLPLPASYDSFLGSLGSRTRRNFRYYRRLSSAAGRTFVDAVPFADFKAACSQLTEEGGTGTTRDGVSRAMTVLAATERPLLVGLKDASGRYISILGGWYEAGRLVVFFQMNSDRKYPRASLSVVLRGHLLEMAIERGIRRIVFWAGSGGVLARYVEQVPTTAVYLDKPSVLWQSLIRIVRYGRSVLPDRFRHSAEWIVPSPGEAR
jgi:hypothetical protein